MIDRDLIAVSQTLEDLTDSFEYNKQIAFDDNFTLFLKKIYGEVPRQFIGVEISYKFKRIQYRSITLYIDADTPTEIAQRIHFVFMDFLNLYCPEEWISSIELKWT